MDKQTVRGKAPWGVLQAAQKQHVPVIAIAGSMEDVREMNQAGFSGIFSIAPGPVSLEKAMQPDFARENIKRLVSQICNTIISL
jgi:glycerate kinase